MKLIILIAALFAVAMAAPANEEHVEIVKLDSDVSPDGYSFE